jgi:hypothetical protein
MAKKFLKIDPIYHISLKWKWPNKHIFLDFQYSMLSLWHSFLCGGKGGWGKEDFSQGRMRKGSLARGKKVANSIYTSMICIIACDIRLNRLTFFFLSIFYLYSSLSLCLFLSFFIYIYICLYVPIYLWFYLPIYSIYLCLYLFHSFSFVHIFPSIHFPFSLISVCLSHSIPFYSSFY